MQVGEGFTGSHLPFVEGRVGGMRGRLKQVEMGRDRVSGSEN